MVLSKYQLPQGAYEVKSLNDESQRIIIDEGYFTEADYSFTIKTNFSTFSSTTQISRRELSISFLLDDSIRDLLGFNALTILEEYKLSPDPVDILPFDNIFIECKIAQGMIFRERRSGLVHSWTMTVDPGYQYFEIFAGVIADIR